MAKRESMSSVDTAWLRMERPSNLMMIVGVLVFEGRMDYERLRRTLEARLLCHRRFRQRVVQDVGGAYWEDDPDLDIDNHLHHMALPDSGGKAELEHLVSELAMTPLNPARPLWHMYLIENYNGGSAFIARIHHCIADGIALIGVLLSFTDPVPDAPIPEPAWRRTGNEAAHVNPWFQVVDPMTRWMSKTYELSTKAWFKYVEVATQPLRAMELARAGAGIAGELAKLALMPDDSHTRFKGKVGGVKRVAWSEPIPIDEVKAIGKALGCSVNDVLLSSVAGALRAYLEEKGDSADGIEPRALVPVNLRGSGDEGKLGNRFGLVTLLLPVGEGNPFGRVFEIRRRMTELKGSYLPVVALGLLGAAGMAPKIVQEQVLDLLANKATAVMTNVPGPQIPLYLAGAKLLQPMFWVPQSGNIGMGVSILSYNGAVQFGLITDSELVPDPDAIVARFVPEFEKLLFALLLAPWEGEFDAAALEATLEQELQPAQLPHRRSTRRKQVRTAAAAAGTNPLPRRSANTP